MTTSYTDICGSGLRWPLIDITTDIAYTNGVINYLIDGNTTANNLYFASQEAVGKYLQFDFGCRCIIDEAKWYQHSATYNHGVWRWQGSDNGTDWTTIGADFTWGNALIQTQTTLNGNTTGYRYYRLLGVSGDISYIPYQREIEFKITYNSDATVFQTYSHHGSYGDRTAWLIFTNTIIINGGDGPAGLINGVYESGSYFAATTASGKELKFDFGAGASPIINEAKWYQSGTVTHGVWRWQGSDNGTDWTTIGADFTLGGVTIQYMTTLSGNVTGYRYYRLLGVSGNTSGSGFLQEICFKINSNAAGMDRIQTVQTVVQVAWDLTPGLKVLGTELMAAWNPAMGLQIGSVLAEILFLPDAIVKASQLFLQVELVRADAAVYVSQALMQVEWNIRTNLEVEMSIIPIDITPLSLTLEEIVDLDYVSILIEALTLMPSGFGVAVSTENILITPRSAKVVFAVPMTLISLEMLALAITVEMVGRRKYPIPPSNRILQTQAYKRKFPVVK